MMSAPIHGRMAGRCRATGWAVALTLLAAPAVAQAQVRPALFQPEAPTGPRTANFATSSDNPWTNAHGEPVVVPAGYYGGGGYPPGMGAGCGACGGGGCPCCVGGGGPYPPGGPYGAEHLDPSLDAYGNLNLGPGVDQCGPHYFDFSAEFLYWKKERPADPLTNFATIGINDISEGVDDSLVLNTDDVGFDYEPGMRLTGRYDLGALSFLEASYSGLFEYGAVSRLDGDGNIFTGHSNFGIGWDTTGDGNPDQAVGGVGLNGSEAADFARLELLSELHNAEISFRRYWVGFNPRVSGTVLAGFRYTRLNETLNFSTEGPSGSSFAATQTENDLVGFQFGGDAWVTVRQGCRIGAEGKAGIYNNRMESAANINRTDIDTELVEVVKGDRVAFITEGRVGVVLDVLPSMSLRGGYDVLFINTVALAANNYNFDPAPFLDGARTPVLIEESSSLYHGFHAGLEYVW